MKKEENTTYRILIKTAATCLLALLMVGGVSAQYKGNPVKKDKLVSVLRSKQLQTREIVAVVKSNGVDFQLTPALEKELVTAGARPEVITAIRDNYRQPSAASNPSVASKNNNNKKFTGQPLAKDAIVTLLENGVPDAQVRKNVQARGVNFKVNSQNISEIKRAGGSVALVNLIGASFVSDVGKPSDAGNNTTGSTAGSNAYDDLIDKAVDFYDNKKDKQSALTTLQQAVKMDINNARAYQLLGYMNLYGFSNFTEAERNMRESLNRGGSAVFRVFHDHDGLFTTTCNGSLFIAKDTVRFESDDNVHTFQTNDADIKQVKTNSAFRRAFQTKTGSFKIVLKTGEDKDGVKFGFAPLTDNIAESKMIIRLIGKND